MKNAPFVIWMIGYPLTITFAKYVSQYLIGNSYTDTVLAITNLIQLIIWFVIGYALFEKEDKQNEN